MRSRRQIITGSKVKQMAVQQCVLSFYFNGITNETVIYDRELVRSTSIPKNVNFKTYFYDFSFYAVYLLSKYR